MSKESWEILERNASSSVEDSEPRRPMGEARGAWGERNVSPELSMSRICHETGRLEMHSAEELRAQLGRLRSGQAIFPCERPQACRNGKASGGLVVVDDELHGPDGEWLGVAGLSEDGKTFELVCYETGTRFFRPAHALVADVGRCRLRVLRPGIPFVPPELEEDPHVFIDEDGWF